MQNELFLFFILELNMVLFVSFFTGFSVFINIFIVLHVLGVVCFAVNELKLFLSFIISII